MKYVNLVRDIIKKERNGKAFVISDFVEFMDYETAKKILTRLEKEKIIRRVARGVYDKPYFSNILNEYVPPDPNEIASAIARNFNWEIIPSGETALNLLGLSTQVPSKYIFISTGPYKRHSFDFFVLEFVHRSNKQIFKGSYISSLVIQALKALGKENIDGKTIESLSNKLSKKEKTELLLEGKRTTSWIYSAIKRICEDEKTDDFKIGEN